jgi:hypothetical protein
LRARRLLEGIALAVGVVVGAPRDGEDVTELDETELIALLLGEGGDFPEIYELGTSHAAGP